MTTNTTSSSGQTTSLDLYYTPEVWEWTNLIEYQDWCMADDRFTQHRVIHVRMTSRYRPQMYLVCGNCGSMKTRMGSPWSHWPRMAPVGGILNRLTQIERPPHECPKCHMGNMTHDPYEVKGWKCLSCGMTLTRNQAKHSAGTVYAAGNSRLGT